MIIREACAFQLARLPNLVMRHSARNKPAPLIFGALSAFECWRIFTSHNAFTNQSTPTSLPPFPSIRLLISSANGLHSHNSSPAPFIKNPLTPGISILQPSLSGTSHSSFLHSTSRSSVGKLHRIDARGRCYGL